MKTSHLMLNLIVAGFMTAGAILWAAGARQDAPPKKGLDSYKASERLAKWSGKQSSSSQSKVQAPFKTGNNAQSEAVPQFEGALIYSDDWSYNDYGVYTFTAQSPISFN